MKKMIFLFLCLTFSLSLFGLENNKAKKTTLAKYLSALDKGATWLSGQQNKNGSFGKIPGLKVQGDVGITGIVLMGLASCPSDIRKKNQKTLDRGVAYLLAHQTKDGAILNPNRGIDNYQTSVSVIALCYVDKKKYSGVIEKAKKYLVGTQFSEAFHGVSPKSLHYGGWDYKRHRTEEGEEGLDSDMSNVQFAMEALKEAGLDKNSPVWKRAVKFLSRCQNRSESNDMKAFAVLNDGGFMYYPGNSKAGPIKTKSGKLAYPSYASMTYAGLKSFIYAQVDKKDGRVQGAYNWIQRNYTLNENYGLGTRKNPKGGQQGLYYYYVTFAKALSAWGKSHIRAADGKNHPWAKELADKLTALQNPQGYWVNHNPRWWESNKTLVTSYSLNALNLCVRNLQKK